MVVKEGIREIREIEPDSKELEPEEDDEEEVSLEGEVEEGVEQFNEGFVSSFSFEGLDGGFPLDNPWVSRNLERSLSDVILPSKKEEVVGDFYGGGSSSGFYGESSNGDLYSSDDGAKYGLGEGRGYSDSSKGDSENIGELRHANASRLEIKGLREGFGKTYPGFGNRRKEYDSSA